MAVIPLGAVLATSLLLFTTLDKKIFDIFLRLAPPLKEDPKVLLINIDDMAIENIGSFPWPRNVVADSMIVLKELGAESLTFDLSYLDPSPLQIEKQYIREELPKTVRNGFADLDSWIGGTMDEVASGKIGRGQAGTEKVNMLARSTMARESILESIDNVSRDNDEYFAAAIRFFGQAYLTLTMVMPSDMKDSGSAWDMSGVDMDKISGRYALKGLDLSRDGGSPKAIGIVPAIPQLLYSGGGAGFVNIPVDADGKMRRVHLVMAYDGKAYPHLIMPSLLTHLGQPQVKVDGNRIRLVGAKLGDKSLNISIPRSQDGSVLVNWPRKQYKEYNSISVWSLIKASRLEGQIIENLKAMQRNGYFAYWDGEKSPLESNDECQYIRAEMSAEGGNEEELTHDIYRQYHAEFLDITGRFLNGPYLDKILAAAGDDPTLKDSITQTFAIVREDYKNLLEIRAKAKQRVDGALCIIGVDASSMTDVGLTTYQKRYPNVGTYAVIANMVLSRNFLDDAPAYVQIILGLLMALALSFAINKMDIKHAMIAGSLSILAVLVLYVLAFLLSKCYLGLTVPLFSLLIVFVSFSVINFLRTSREKSFLRSAFSRYLSPAVISEIIQDPSKLNLGGENREMTAIFTDIKGFSGIAEKLSPGDLVKLLNIYLTAMSDIILENRGTIDKYEGDAIIAFFGAPMTMEDHAQMACRTAIMMKKAEEELNRRVLEEGLSPSALFTRIGINSGDMVVGNMGTATQMNYTIMGHSVNLAARLEGVNKQYNTRGILISEYTRAKLGDDFCLRRLDSVRVVGVSTPIRLYELLGLADECDQASRSRLSEWEGAVDVYEGGDFNKALAAFAALSQSDPRDGVARLYAARCQDLMSKGPGFAWDPVANLTQK